MITIAEATATNEQLQAENTLLKQMLADVKAPEVLQAKIDAKTAEIQELTAQKAEVYAKPLSDAEKAELAGMHQRQIEAKQAEKLALEQDKADLENLIIPA